MRVLAAHRAMVEHARRACDDGGGWWRWVGSRSLSLSLARCALRVLVPVRDGNNKVREGARSREEEEAEAEEGAEEQGGELQGVTRGDTRVDSTFDFAKSVAHW